ncbi:hypothetical protein MVEG_04210 [Podila verticillata NRRL 6337]|nr:hypothetical protein MVEG_04210 [Podila verticillata NRRL 6337]
MTTAPYAELHTLSSSATLTTMVDHCNLQPSSMSPTTHSPYEFPPSSSEICPRDLEVIQDVDEEHLDEDPDHASLRSQPTPAQPIPTSSNSRRFSRRLSYHQYQYHSTSNTCPSTPALSSSPPMQGMFSCSSSVTSSPGGNSMPMSPSLVGMCQFCGGAGVTAPLPGHGHSNSGQWTSDLRQYIMTDIGPQPSNSQVPALRSGSHLVRQRSSSKISPAAATMPLANGGLVCPECGGCGQQSIDGVVYGGGLGSFYGRYSSVTDLCTIPQDEILPPMKVPFERRFVGHDEWDDDE